MLYSHPHGTFIVFYAATIADRELFHYISGIGSMGALGVGAHMKNQSWYSTL